MAHDTLVGFDGSEQAVAALRYTLERNTDSTIHVVHANDPRDWAGFDDMGGIYSEQAFEHMRERSRQILEEAEAMADEYGVKIQTERMTGKPDAAIIQYAEDHSIDHIVVGTHGRAGIARVLLGSVAERVVRRAPVSVTVVRDKNSH